MKPIHHKAKKRFGQNFLHDPTVIGRIVSTINPKPGDNIIEIGPGPGALTQPVLKQAGKMRAIELDREVIPKLRMYCFGDGELEIIESDALKIDFKEFSDSPRSLRIIGNLPYNISTPLLFHLFEHLEVIKDMHFMLQKEVVDRLCAVPGTKDYGRLSIMAQYYARPEFMFLVKPGAFNPPPKVDSAIIRLTPKEHNEHDQTDVKTLNGVVTSAFSLRRKTVRNSLKSHLSEDELNELDIKPTERAENLTLDQYIRIANYLTAKKR
ncbi:16S rRNA (adenine(1518)-N(6)/adenine(1519)-N(6))-dimethyltransferase RsmA [Pleionea sediminis]|uniref:16S rRNA (adenine(1518)-N(6)/adenine(1519)-N(6))- dimethyltransferase RsmA n=1 Tax=Pleionea sediminis TaxID=2569479 RepID=UPI001186BC9C|nr:16S rRNA (adenine(1518)-N(6)/adenine(1519)-N(6))-dimethyltransferase RsmA [Pleionea sediminis]